MNLMECSYVNHSSCLHGIQQLCPLASSEYLQYLFSSYKQNQNLEGSRLRYRIGQCLYQLSIGRLICFEAVNLIT